MTFPSRSRTSGDWKENFLANANMAAQLTHSSEQFPPKALITNRSVNGTPIPASDTMLRRDPSLTETDEAMRKKKDKDYIFGKVIGEGSFSTVFLVKDVRTGKQFAMKVCDKMLLLREKKTEYVKREREALLRLNANPSPFIIRLYATFQDASRLYFVLSYAKNGELLTLINKASQFDEACTRFYAAELLCALEHLHRMHMIHRDIKPENILLDEKMHVQLADFGSVKILEANSKQEKFREVKRRNSFVGTAQYVAPEILSDKEQSTSVDLWSFGCTIFQMASGHPPFRASNEYLAFQKVLKAEYVFPETFNPTIKDLVEKLLIIEPSERLGANDAEDEGYPSIRSHPLFNGLVWDSLQEQTPPTIPDGETSGSSSDDDLSIDYQIPDGLEPGLDDKQLSRLLGLDLCDIDPEMLPSSQPEPTSYSSARFDFHRLLHSDIPRVMAELDLWVSHQTTDSWHERVGNNVILKMGMVHKRKGLIARPRMFILTSGPHLYYFETLRVELKGEIPWSNTLKAEGKNFRHFLVHTPGRTYYLEDPTHGAKSWCDFINAVKDYYYPNT